MMQNMVLIRRSAFFLLLQCLLLLLLLLPQVDPERLIDFTGMDPACETMIPTINHNAIGSTNESNFRLRIFDESGRETYEYDVKNRRTLYVKVEGGAFVRAHIQARSVAHPTVQVGSFIAPPPQYFKLVNCSGVYGAAIINDDHVTRRHTGVQWKPPRIAKGPIVFLASIIYSKKLFHIRSAFLSPYTDFIDVSSLDCTRSHGCFKAGEDGCAFADTCRFSLKWRCYKNAMIVDAVHNGEMTSFGLATEDQYAVMCVSRQNSVTAEDFIIVGQNGFPNIFGAPRSKRLKAIRDSRRIYCRFEMQRPKPNSTDFIYGDVDEYGHPYKLKRWKIPVSNLCEPHFIHSTERVADEDSLSSSRQATISGVLYSPYNAHLFASIGLSFALMLWDI